MRIIARYLWGKTQRGYGWNLWEGSGLSLAKDSTSGRWTVYNADGSLLCRCVTYQDAQRVVARFRRLALAQMSLNTERDFAAIVTHKDGWAIRSVDSHEEPERLFSTLEEAQAYLAARELIPRS